MQNQQLVDYVKQQMQGGVALDAIKKALLDAGWPAADVEDSIKAAVPAGGAASPAATPLTVKKFDPAAAMGGTAIAGASAGVAAMSPKTTFFTDGPHEVQPKHSWGRVAVGVMAVVILILLGALAYVYYSLNGKVAAGAGQTASGADAQALQDQLTKLAEDKNNLMTQTNALTADNQTLMGEVGFFTLSSSTLVSSTVKGVIGSNAGGYLLTTPHNILIAIKNSKDAKVDAALKPLLGQTAELSGTHRPGFAELTVTAVNGLPPAASVAPAATSSAPVPPSSMTTPPATGFPPATSSLPK
jgi:hypothetical protein